MAANQEEINRREKAAIAAIKNAFGAENDEYGGTLFVTHHLVEIEKDYWRDHLATTQPEPMQVFEILVLKSHWGGDDGIDIGHHRQGCGVRGFLSSVINHKSQNRAEKTEHQQRCHCRQRWENQRVGVLRDQ